MKKILILLFAIVSINIFSIELRTLYFSDYFGLIEPGEDYTSLRQRNYIRPELSLDLFNYSAAITLSAEFYYDYFAEATFNESTIPSYDNILREFYYAHYLDWGDIIIGQKFINKGKVDVFTPLNIFNASYRDLLSLDEPYQSKRPDLMLEVNYYPTDDSSVELVYIPFPRSDYQGTNNLYIDDLGATLIEKSDSYLTNPNNSAFLTYNYYGFSFDTQITYGNYIDGNYNYKLSYDGTEITKSFNRVQTAGAAISSSIGEVALVGELAFNLTEDFNGNDPGIKNSDITLNTQLTKTLFGRTYSQINIIYQHIFNYSEASSLYEEAVYDVHLQPTDNIVFIIGHIHDSFLREKLYTALNLGFFFSTDVYVAPRVNYHITDRVTLETGADIYTGKYQNKLLNNDLKGDNFFIRIKQEF